MKILIAGATGLIGQELVKQCLDAEIGVHYLTTGKGKIQNEDNYQGFYWNPSKGEIDPKAFEEVSAVINLAGASVSKRWTEAHKIRILESRIMTANLLFSTMQSLDHSITHYISSSGISIYPSSKTVLYHEDSTQIADSFLGKVVVEWEAAADQFKALGIKVAKVRTGIVLDSNDGALPQISKPIKLGVGAALGSGEQWQSWIHIEDIAAIYLFLLKKELEGIFNGVAPGPVTNIKMTKIVAKHLNKPLWLPKVPKFMLKLIMGEMAAIAFESQLVSAKKLEEAGYLFHYVNLEKAIEDLL